MREIKFRGKAINGDWVFGLLTKKKIRNSGELSFAIATADCSLANTVPVIENTIGEFTGFTDKNGVDVFDGDILKDFQGYTCSVARALGGFNLLYPDNDAVPLAFTAPFFQMCGFEVVGNIFEGNGDAGN